ncbi:uncharacterized protein LOC119603607 [Lucilia sericata]|uniref:uncharacterized protein LOC119603607 n=1 Tax=Lucilia sericata TaxID=13632 RepID=UPI0018A8144E|nr:uncharacterized protein LOC119603607 [Lucilia sericata]XP_037811618.1 uncharacterized protein LOC119603607 [Lucilia sericata]
MEFALPELLSRDDILRILNQRHLPIQNMNELTHDELLRVYKTFVMPLSRRPERSKKCKHNSTVPATNLDCVNDKRQHMQVETIDSASNSMDIDFPSVTLCPADNTRMTSPLGEKRRQESSDEDYLDIFENDYQFQLSSVTKRIRINTLS